MKYVIRTRIRKLLADTLTPVNIYLKLRDVYAGSILLESSDYHGHENSLSYLCCDPIAFYQVKEERIEMKFPDRTTSAYPVERMEQVQESLEIFLKSFQTNAIQPATAGLFGYLSFDAVRYFEDVHLTIRERTIPDILYKMYRYVIIVNHFTNELRKVMM